jgi:hypothetical protein
MGSSFKRFSDLPLYTYTEFNVILDVKIYTLDREARVSGETCVTVCMPVRGIQRGRIM